MKPTLAKGGVHVVRFRVVKASHIAVAVGALVLLGVMIALAVSYVSASGDSRPTGNFVSAPTEAEASVGVMRLELMTDDAAAEQPTPAPRSGPAKVLIYHTHTHEAYRQDWDNLYDEAGEKWRTQDNEFNVVRIGTALTEALKARGIDAIHDPTDFEQDSYETAYDRSLEMLEPLRGEYDLYIDLHRDAGEGAPEGGLTVSDGDRRVARTVFLVGTGDGFDEKPDSAANYRLALRLTDSLNARLNGLARDVVVTDQRYHQHIGLSLLLEVGRNQNTLSEALAAVPYIAEALAAEFGEQEQ